ncbi:MAG: hypothetical protein J5613_02805 [Alphaproteobacteria bacterium]|nr:hypothetical protein [Alphaproteobacteria bacterium]
MKRLLLLYLVRVVFIAIALGVGIWYLSSSIGGSTLSYTSMDTFLTAIGAPDGNIANANGCFLCTYINDLFIVLGRAAENFWTAMLDNLWILMALGFGIFLIVHTIKFFMKSITEAAKLDTSEKKFVFNDWFDPAWRLGVRIMIVGAIIGAFGMGGISAIKTLSSITIEPVMYVGSQLSMAATGVLDYAECIPSALPQTNPMSTLANSFMCIVANVNTVMLAGAAGGFSLMNYAWLGLGGGILTWIAGLLTVIMFLVVGFDLFFDLLSVIFKLIFVIIFLPFFVAANAFEKTWKMASGVLTRALDMLIGAAVKVIAISLKVVILYAIVSFSGREIFPGSGIFPPLLKNSPETEQSIAVHNVFAICEAQATQNGEVDKDLFTECFNAQKVSVEQHYPHAFDFLHDGWGFLILMIGIYCLYMYVLSPKVDKLIAAAPTITVFKKTGEDGGGGGLDDFGGEMRKFGKLAWNKPKDWLEKYIKENV